MVSLIVTSAAQYEFGTNESISLGRIVGAANARVKRLTGRSFVSATYTEKFDGERQSKLLLRERPIASITYVKCGEVEYSADSYTFEAATGVLGLVASMPATIANTSINAAPFARRGLSAEFPYGFQNIEVRYVGGLADPSDELTLVKDVTMNVARMMWSNRQSSLDLESESIGQYSYTRKDSVEIDNYILSMLSGLSAGVL